MQTYFITIKQGTHNLANKVAVHCEEKDLTATAKQIRKGIADQWKIKPSRLDWAVFDYINPDNPFIEQTIIKQSENFKKWTGGIYHG